MSGTRVGLAFDESGDGARFEASSELAMLADSHFPEIRHEVKHLFSGDQKTLFKACSSHLSASDAAAVESLLQERSYSDYQLVKTLSTPSSRRALPLVVTVQGSRYRKQLNLGCQRFAV